MTITDDLATLRDWLPPAQSAELGRALDRVEAEIAQLKEERDGSVFLRSLADASADTWRNRAEAAEAEAARLRRLVDEARPYSPDHWLGWLAASIGGYLNDQETIEDLDQDYRDFLRSPVATDELRRILPPPRKRKKVRANGKRVGESEF